MGDIDFIGSCESFYDDFSLVKKRLNLPVVGISSANRTKHKHYTEYYDDETKQIVAEKYAKEIKYFGYKFE